MTEVACEYPDRWGIERCRREMAAFTRNSRFAHDANPQECAVHILRFAIRYVQFLRRCRDDGWEEGVFTAVDLYENLFQRFRNDLSRWNGEGEIPPEFVDLLDLPWPDTLSECRQTLSDLRQVMLPGLTVVTARLFKPCANSYWEEEFARDYLLTRLPDIEQLAVQLRRSLPEESLPEATQTAASVSDSEKEERLTKMAKAPHIAYQAYQYAEQKLLELCPGRASVTDRQAYDYLKEQEFEDYPLPAFDTWQRYVRDARRVLGEQKNQTRRGRTGRSIRHADELD